ncbi:MAG: GAF domain-containing SpoIIE family protein phosphatase [Candidatus Eisenbacteria bacterium]
MQALADRSASARQCAHSSDRTAERAQNEALFKIGLVLNRKLSLEEIIVTLLDQLQKVLLTDAAALYLLQPGTSELSWFRQRGYAKGTEEQVHLKLGRGLVGWVAGSGTPLIVPDVANEPRYVDARPQTRSEMVIPIESEGRVLGVLNLESDRPGRFTNEDVRMATAFANQAAISIERAHLVRELEKTTRLEHELAVARKIQQTFLPAAAPDLPGIDLAGINLPSAEVSGDAYDYLRITERQLALMIADVSGKGVSAALITATLRASLRAEARNRYSTQEIVMNVNRLLWESIEPGQFVTAVYGVLDLGAMRFSYVNAGHNAPVLLRRDGTVERLRAGGPMLGPFPDRKYDLGVVDLLPGDLVHFYTDGVTEAGGPAREPFGPDRLIEVLRHSRGTSSEAVNQAVLAAVEAHAGPARHDDDITLVTLQVHDRARTPEAVGD